MSALHVDPSKKVSVFRVHHQMLTVDGPEIEGIACVSLPPEKKLRAQRMKPCRENW